jgi:hypothetical protein
MDSCLQLQTSQKALSFDLEKSPTIKNKAISKVHFMAYSLSPPEERL